jgi:GNAT superfamily N-acetyltransferase
MLTCQGRRGGSASLHTPHLAEAICLRIAAAFSVGYQSCRPSPWRPDLDRAAAPAYDPRVLDNVIIRSASEAELGGLGELKLHSSLGWGDFVEELRALPGARQVPPEHLPFAFVADQGGAAIGFATVLPAAGQDAELEDLFVHPDAWGRGVGGALVAEAERRAVALGFRGLRVIANRRALPFYEAMGFTAIGTVETLFEPAPVMRKALT